MILNKKVFVSFLVLVNVITSILIPILFSKLSLIIISISVLILIIIIHFFLKTGIILSSGTFNTNIIFYLTFLWGITNFIISYASYTLPKFNFLIQSRNKNVPVIQETKSLNTTEIVVNQNQISILKGKVLSYSNLRKDYIPVQNAKIVLKDKSNRIIFYENFSDIEGKFSITINFLTLDDFYHLFITHPEYNPYFTKIKFSSGFTYDTEFFLTKK